MISSHHLLNRWWRANISDIPPAEMLAHPKSSWSFVSHRITMEFLGSWKLRRKKAIQFTKQQILIRISEERGNIKERTYSQSADFKTKNGFMFSFIRAYFSNSVPSEYNLNGSTPFLSHDYKKFMFQISLCLRT